MDRFLVKMLLLVVGVVVQQQLRKQPRVIPNKSTILQYRKTFCGLLSHNVCMWVSVFRVTGV